MGKLSLRIAVHDLAAARAGSLEIPVTVTAAGGVGQTDGR
jgi:hypothetical protein